MTYDFNYFKQETKENLFPKSLIYLTFGEIFNQKIKENVLPQSLTHLTFESFTSLNI